MRKYIVPWLVPILFAIAMTFIVKSAGAGFVSITPCSAVSENTNDVWTVSGDQVITGLFTSVASGKKVGQAKDGETCYDYVQPMPDPTDKRTWRIWRETSNSPRVGQVICELIATAPPPRVVAPINTTQVYVVAKSGDRLTRPVWSLTGEKRKQIARAKIGMLCGEPSRALQVRKKQWRLWGDGEVYCEPGDVPTSDNIEIMAINYSGTTTASAHMWERQKESMEALPNMGVLINTDYVGKSPRLDYVISLNEGTYYVWVLGVGKTGGDDSVHVGLDGKPQKSASRISGFKPAGNWSNNTMDKSRAAISVPAAGDHTINVWMREDGFSFSKILLVQNAALIP